MSDFPLVIDLSALTLTEGFIIQGDRANDRTGYSVSSAGDVNGDGISDVIVGAPGPAPACGICAGYIGEAYVIFGKQTGLGNIDLTNLTSSQGFIIQGVQAGDEAGYSVSSAGDVNGDGISDVIVGSPSESEYGDLLGEAYLIYGKQTGLGNIDLTNLTSSQGFIIQSDVWYGRTGRSVSSAGDVNGDGVDDLIVGAPSSGDGGEAYVIYGQAGGHTDIDLSTLTLPQGFIIQGDVAGDFAGASVSSAGDVNGDGVDDLIVGASGGNDGGSNAGEAYVIYGKQTGLGNIDLTNLTTSQGFIIQGDAAGDLAGHSVSSAGDVNGDGFDDVIVGALGSDDGGSAAGEAYVIYGRQTGLGNIDLTNLTTSQGFIIQGDAAGDSAGASVSSAGDVNGDGFDDVIIGAPRGDDGGSRAGEAYVIFGQAAGPGNIDLTNLTTMQGFIIQGDAAIDFAGTSVSSAGDVNGDGFDDVMVGAPRGDDGGPDAGEAYVVYGRAPQAAAVRFGADADQTIRGGAFDDYLNGLGGDDTLIGGGGSDLLLGSNGNDVLEGMTGGDALLGGAGFDTASYAASNDTVAVNIGNGTGAGAHAADDILVGIENLTGSQFGDLLRGGNATANNSDIDNVLSGMGGGDVILGDEGDDTINGGAGGDIMTGGAGNDAFVFESLRAELDIIIDFDQNGDDILTFTGFGPGFDFNEIQLYTVNGNDVFITAIGWQGGVVLKDAVGQVDAGDFVFE